mgnify:CR=1 FL=1
MNHVRYYIARILLVSLKPMALIAVSYLIDDLTANHVALALAISAITSAALSLGIYRRIYKASGRKRLYHESCRRVYFYFHTVFICVALYLVQLYDLISDDLVYIVMVIVITDHVIHDESRYLLYSGDREKWAVSSLIRGSYLIAAPAIYVLIEGITFVEALLLSSLPNYIYSIVGGGLMMPLGAQFSVIKRKSLYLRYFALSNYLIASISTKIVQQSDRLLFSFVSYDSLWLYSLVAQVGNISAMLWEMVEVSKLKERVAKLDFYRYRSFDGYYIKKAIIFSSFASVCFAFLIVIEPNLLDVYWMVLFVIILISNIPYMMNMINMEQFFWRAKRPIDFLKLEIFISVPIIFLGSILVGALGMAYLVKIPFLATQLLKANRLSKCMN